MGILLGMGEALDGLSAPECQSHVGEAITAVELAGEGTEIVGEFGAVQSCLHCHLWVIAEGA